MTADERINGREVATMLDVRRALGDRGEFLARLLDKCEHDIGKAYGPVPNHAYVMVSIEFLS